MESVDLTSTYHALLCSCDAPTQTADQSGRRMCRRSRSNSLIFASCQVSRQVRYAATAAVLYLYSVYLPTYLSAAVLPTYQVLQSTYVPSQVLTYQGTYYIYTTYSAAGCSTLCCAVWLDDRVGTSHAKQVQHHQSGTYCLSTVAGTSIVDTTMYYLPTHLLTQVSTYLLCTTQHTRRQVER